jgi:hypothetical protein
MKYDNPQIKLLTTSVEEFLKIPDNPIQRDTERHATRANRPGGHLSTASPTHSKVAIARTADGKKQWLLDGHCRRWLWDLGALESPKKLYCDVYVVKNAAEAQELYVSFDSSSSVETSSDQMFGAFRLSKFEPRTRLFQNAGALSAMKALAFPPRWSDIRNLSIIQLCEPYIKTFRIIDESADIIRNHQLFPSSVMCAMLATVRADGQIAMPFWEAYQLKEGTKDKNSADGVYMATERFRWLKEEKYGRRGGLSITTNAPLFIHFYEQWKQGKRLPTKRGRPAKITEIPTLSEWWHDRIGEYDHPQIRLIRKEDETQQQLELA